MSGDEEVLAGTALCTLGTLGWPEGLPSPAPCRGRLLRCGWNCTTPGQQAFTAGTGPLTKPKEAPSAEGAGHSANAVLPSPPAKLAWVLMRAWGCHEARPPSHLPALAPGHAA